MRSGASASARVVGGGNRLEPLEGFFVGSARGEPFGLLARVWRLAGGHAHG